MTTTRAKTTKRAVSPKAAGKDPTPKAQRGHKPEVKGAKAPRVTQPPTRRPSKGDRLVQMLKRANGATIGELVVAFGTLPHSLRAAISIEKRRRGLTVELRDSRYRVVP